MRLGGLSRHAHDHGSFAKLSRFHASLSAYGQYGGISDGVCDFVRQVLLVPISKMSRDQDLLLIFRFQNGFEGQQFDPLDLGTGFILFLSVRSSTANPIQKHLIIWRSLLNPPTSAMRHGERRLEQQETLLRVLQVDAWHLRPRISGQHLEGSAFDDPFVIRPRAHRVHRQFESAFTLRPSVTGPRVATALHEDCFDVASEAKDTFFS